MAGSDFLNILRLPWISGLLYLAEIQAIVFLILSIIGFLICFKYIEVAVKAANLSTGIIVAISVGVVAVEYVILRYLASGGKCNYKTDLTGKIVIVTGANSGLGFSTATKMAKMNATVIMACRSMTKAEEAIRDIKAQVKDYQSIEAIQLDLSSLASVRQFVKVFREKYPHVDIIICNAGIAWVEFEKTRDGFESHFQSNHLGHFLLVNLLFDYLEKAQGRVVSVSSLAHALVKGIHYDVISNANSYDPQKGYGTSKLANILFTNALQLRMKTSRAYAIHPGFVLTPIDKRIPFAWVRLFTPLLLIIFKTPDEGSESIIYCAIHPNAKPATYVCDCRIAGTTINAKSKEAAEDLWKLSEELVGHKFSYEGKSQ